MKHRAFTRALLIALAVVAAGSGCVLPPPLHKEGLVCDTTEDGPHPHDTFRKWNIEKKVTRLQVDYRSPNFWKNFILAVKQDETELQDIDMHVVNRSKHPLPNRPSVQPGCDMLKDASAYFTDRTIPDFVFAAGMHEIENSPNAPEAKSPHLIVYLPLHTKAPGVYPETAQEFRILLLHMLPEGVACTGTELEKAQCEALKELRKKWNDGDYWNRDFKKRVMTSIKAIVEPEIRVKYHNGVIHGSF